jgi:DNA-binding XRE family transcriptional regulator
VLLRSERLAAGLTQEALAEEAGLTRRTVHAAEHDTRLSISSARALSMALGIPLSALARPRPEEVRERLAQAGFSPLPPPTPWGVRRVETAVTVEALDGGEHGSLLVLAGPTGIGKTALAAHVVALVGERFPDGVGWIQASRTTPERSLIWQLELASALGFGRRLPRPEVVGRSGFDEAFRHALWTRRRLLVIDDVTDHHEVTRFLRRDAGGWVIVTTKSRLVAEELGGRLVEVGPLEEGAAVALLAAHIGEDRLKRDPGGGADLVRILGCVPRSLQIAGRVLKRERFTDLSEYARRVANSPSEPRDERFARGRDGDPEASFTTAFKQLRPQLSAECWDVFGALSALGGARFPARWAAAVSALPESRTRSALAELTDFYLVRDIAPAAGDGALPKFVLDAQSQRAARWTAGSSVGRSEARLLRHAHDDAKRLGAQPPPESIRQFSQNAELWRHCLDLAASRVLPPGAARVATSFEAIPAVDIESAPDARLLPDTLIGLRAPIYLAVPPGAAQWLTAGLAVARACGDDEATGRLCALMGRWTTFNVVNPFATVAWFAAAGRILERAGQYDEAVDAVSYAAKIVQLVEGAEAAIPHFQAALTLCRQHPEVSNLTTAGLLNAFGVVSFMLGGPDDLDWAERLMADAISLTLEGDAGLLLNAVTRLNLAAVLGVRGKTTPSPQLTEAMEIVRRFVRGDDLLEYRVSSLGIQLGVYPRPEGPPDDRQKRAVWLAVPPQLALRRLLHYRQLANEIAKHLSASDGGGDTVAEPAPTAEITVCPLTVGHPLEFEIGVVGLLEPMPPLLNLLEGAGRRYALAFVEQQLGRESAVYQEFKALTARLAER